MAIDSKAPIPVDPAAKKPDATLAKALIATHKRYDEFKSRWEMYLDCYQGINMHNRLFKHIRESKDSLRQRMRRSYYYNYCEPIVDLYVHYIFSKTATRKSDKETGRIVGKAPVKGGTMMMAQSAPDKYESGGNYAFRSTDKILGDRENNPQISSKENLNVETLEWEKWLNNVNRKGDSIDRFMSNAGKFAFAMGHVYVVVDMPKSDRPLVSQQDRMDAQLSPYLSIYFPQDMTNFEVDENGQLLWCRFKEQPPPKLNPFEIAPKKTENFVVANQVKHLLKNEPTEELWYKTWTKKQWFLHKVTKEGAVLVDAGTNPIGEVPVVPVYAASRYARFNFYGRSLIAEISKINVAILNWCSLIDEEIYQKCLNILCMETQPEDREEIVIGNNNTLEYSGQPPFYLAPATDPGSFIQSQIDRARDEIIRISKQGGGMGIEVQAKQSGIAHAYEFNETNRTIAEHAQELETSENKIHKLWHKWMNREWAGEVDYPDEFSIESFDQEISIAMQSRNVIFSERFHKEQEKKLAKKMMQNISEEIEREIMEEIEKGPQPNQQQQQPDQQPDQQPQAQQQPTSQASKQQQPN